MKRVNQTGSHPLAITLVALVLGLAVFTGYKVWQMQNNKTATQASATEKTAPETITTTKDLDDTSAALDSSSAQLDANLDDSSLDADLGDML